MDKKEWNEDSIKAFFMEYLTKEKRLQATTYNDYIRHLRQALSWCNQEDLIVGNWGDLKKLFPDI